MFSTSIRDPSDLKSAYPVYRPDEHSALMSQYQANNRYKNFPPLMSDGRSLVGGWTPSIVTDVNTAKTNRFENNLQYRQFMTNNSKEIAKNNFYAAANDVGYTKRTADLAR
jgi:hypothetical protein